MKVISAPVMQDADRCAITERGIPGLSLMERAGEACVKEILTRFGMNGYALILAGKGNNGGDGFVIARLLHLQGWRVAVALLAEPATITGDAATNLTRLPADVLAVCTTPVQLTSLPFAEATLVVDAVLGTGLANEVSGLLREAITRINNSGRPVLAVDIPSGIHATTGEILGTAVNATVTVTFASAKIGHVLYPGASHTGALVVADIGIPADILESAPGHFFLDEQDMRPLVPVRDRQGHKGTYGHCLILAGSTGKTGAAALAANSAVRAGAGLVTLAVPRSVHTILEVKTTEAMTVPLEDEGTGAISATALPFIKGLLSGKDALALGPGLGTDSSTADLVRELITTVPVPLVIDADGLNILAENRDILKRRISQSVILTPHPGEMARLTGLPLDTILANPIATATAYAAAYDVYLILKGARTIIASPMGPVAINGSGNPGMASGGMGDVLTGIIVSLLVQGHRPWHACCLGVFLHGYAADLIAAQQGELGMCASDVLEQLPRAYHTLLHKEN